MIDGNAGTGLGENMMSGTIHVKGNTSQSTGATAHGGTIIIDGDASRLNAIHLAQQVRRNEDNDNVMILGVFSSIDDEENILMIKSAMNAYIEKPINLTKFHYYLEVSKGEPEDVSS
mgnify:CR=1 FL=1